MSKKKLPWWPDTPNHDKDAFYMSIAELAYTYFFSICALVGGIINRTSWGKFFLPGVLTFYLLVFCIIEVRLDEDLTRMEKIQSFVQQTTVALLLISPLIYLNFFCSDWPS